jgi:predicted PurR-regulated permease PerM
VAGAGTLLWLVSFGVPDPLALAVLVGIFDLVPVVGSTVGGAIVTLVALTVSLPTAIATLGFYLVYRLLEDYLLVPRVMRATVSVSPLITIVALILGASLLGIIGALLAVPVAAAVQLMVTEVAVPRQDRS